MTAGRVRYAAMFLLSYTCGLIALAAAAASVPLHGHRVHPQPLRRIAATARQHAAELDK